VARIRVRTQVIASALGLSFLGLGCEGERNTTASGPFAATVLTKSFGPMDAKLDVSPPVASGDKVQVSVEITNRADSTLYLERGNEWPPFNVVILRQNGDTVWARNPDGIRDLVAMAPLPLEPSATRALGAVEWDLRDGRGQIVAPGRYLVLADLWIGSSAVRKLLGPLAVTITR
jgi:hypothetical protein